MARYSIKPRRRKYIQEYGFLSFWRNLSNKYGRQLLDAASKTRLDALKTATQKIAHKAVEVIRKFMENEISNKIVKPKPGPDVNSGNVEKIIIPPRQK